MQRSRISCRPMFGTIQRRGYLEVEIRKL
jgi:hypothetical protein